MTKSRSDAPACEVRPLGAADAAEACALYTELTFGPPVTDRALFLRVLEHPGTTVHGVFAKGGLVAMVTLNLLPNPTWDGRPYGLIENVVTRGDQRGRGFGRMAMQAALDRAWSQNAFKVMLMTGQKRRAKGFYEACGFSSEDKHALVICHP